MKIPWNMWPISSPKTNRILTRKISLTEPWTSTSQRGISLSLTWTGTLSVFCFRMRSNTLRTGWESSQTKRSSSLILASVIPWRHPKEYDTKSLVDSSWTTAGLKSVWLLTLLRSHQHSKFSRQRSTPLMKAQPLSSMRTFRSSVLKVWTSIPWMDICLSTMWSACSQRTPSSSEYHMSKKRMNSCSSTIWSD